MSTTTQIQNACELVTTIVHQGQCVSVTVVGVPGPSAPGSSGGLRFLGALPSVADLPVTGTPGDAYVIDGRIHMFSTAGAWVDSGPVGAPGADGTDGKDGQIRFTGRGAPPTVIVGAEPGDTYLDLDTGDIYKLT